MPRCDHKFIDSTTCVKCGWCPPMTHEERRRLIRRPIVFHHIPPRSWGGVNLGNAGSVPTDGHRISIYDGAGAEFDDSYIRYGVADDAAQGD